PEVHIRSQNISTHQLLQRSKKKRYNFDHSFTGNTRKVLFERSNHNGAMLGWTDNYVRVGIPYNERYENKILPVQLGTRSREGYLIGELTPEAKEEQRVIMDLVG